MNQADFRKTYSDQHKQNLESSYGQHLIQALGAMRPPYVFPQQPHLLTENSGAMRGYELCLRNLVGLSVPYTVQHEPEPNYGVPTAKA